MLFNSYPFIFVFLPFFLACWQLASSSGPRTLSAVFLFFSLVFYACWGLPFCLLLAAMIALNYGSGLLLAASPQPMRKWFLAAAISLNLMPLLWFKYSWFFIRNFALLFGADWQFTPPGLPLGVSFYTFIQIAWLVGIYRDEIRLEGIRRHALFSCCFPYVISGPIVRYGQVGWQFDRLASAAASGVAAGFSLFSIGLAKKAILADSVGQYADTVFGAAAKGWPLASLEAWLGSFCYTFQLYFDFSGYTDMALGLALMVGLRLPENFNSPYKATGIVDFWRRWHITLSSWLRDFLYIPMGGNRRGKIRQYLNLFLTMLIGGAWHGAGWTFVIWGALHGLMLCVNHFFRSCVRETRLAGIGSFPPLRFISILFTFLCVNFCWVVFRASDLDAALAMYAAMFTGPFVPDATSTGNFFKAYLPNSYLPGWLPLALLALCAAVCWFFPASQQIIAGGKGFLRWRPTHGWAAGMAILAFVALVLLTRQSAFLYFQF